MEVQLRPGKYVVAVSGGVDSMVLLQLLLKIPQVELVVAHYDHGIRPESTHDKQFVEAQCKTLGVTFEYEEGVLGSTASEATARDYRYGFLRRIKDKYAADMIATAHHQDDLIETMCINLLRGTHRRGLTSLKSTAEFVRPLLDYSKQEIVQFAKEHKITWVEDQSNTDRRYLRNQIRLDIIPRMTQAQREEVIGLQQKLTKLNHEIDQYIATLLSGYVGTIKRTWFLQFPFMIQSELVAEILRGEDQEVTRDKVIKTVVGIKTLLSGKQLEISGNLSLLSKAHDVKFVRSST